MNDLRIEKPYRRADGHVGARASVTVEHPERSQTYSFDTHGMTSTETAERIASIERYHLDKTERLERMRRLHGFALYRGYVIVDCTILDRGVTLYVDVRPAAKGFPIRRAYHRIEDMPTNDAILKMTAEALPDDGAIDAAHAEFVAKVEARRA